MSYFDDQEDAWFENGCQGNPSDYDPYDPDTWDHIRKPYIPSPNKVRSSAGRSRCLLALDKIEEFAAWAEMEGFNREPIKGEYEVLRLRFPKYQPYIFFKRANAKYATSQSEGTQLVQRWIRSRDKERTILTKGERHEATS